MSEDPDYRSLSLAERIDAFKNTLVARATGEGGDEKLFVYVRKELLADAALAKRTPKFVRSCRNLGEFWGVIQPKFGTYKERRAWLAEEFDPLLTYVEENERSPMSRTADLALESMNSEGVNDVWRRMLDRRDADPAGAITAARTLVETVCKHILDDLLEDYDDSAELPALYKAVATKLNLAPEQHGEAVFKQILGGCATAVNGLASVRNKLSDAHGKGPHAARPSARHAELAVNLSGTLAAFLVATWVAGKTPPTASRQAR